MPRPDQLLAFTLAAFVLIAVPGPSVLFVVTRSMTLGRRAGLATVLGNALGVYVQITAVAFGLGALVEDSAEVYTAVKLVGAAYLVLLGVQAVRHRGALAAALHASPAPRTGRRVLADAFLVGIANPKVIVFFAAVLPQFVDRSSGAVSLQMLLLGAVFFVIALVSDGAWALAAGAARTWLARSERRLAVIGSSGGAVMIGLGLWVAVTGRRD
jgi:threonine/homoserine/homoserine lactone efflux protein